MAWVVWIRDTHAVSINVANNGGKVGKTSSSIFWSIFSFGTFSSSVICTHHEWRLKSRGAGLTSPANEDLSTRQYLVQLFRSHGTTSNVLPQLNHSFYCHDCCFAIFHLPLILFYPIRDENMQDGGAPLKWKKKSAIWLPLYCSQDFETIESGWKAILGHLASTVMNASWTTNHAYNGYSFPIMETLCIKIIKTNFGVYSLLRSVLPFVEFDLNFVTKTWLAPICQKKERGRKQAKTRGF